MLSRRTAKPACERCIFRMSALHSILSGPLFPGVGEATARKLERHFGVLLSAVLEKQDARALSVVVTERKAELVMQGWRSYAAKRELTDWLQQLGVGCEIADIAFKVWGQEAVKRINANPYRLLAFLDWREVDCLSLRIGIDEGASIRLVASAEAAAYAALEGSQSTWIAETELRAGVSVLLGSDAEKAHVAIALAESAGALLKFGDGYQVPGAYYSERFVEEWVSKRRETREASEEWLEQFADGLSDQQRMALRNAVCSEVSVFHGAAGTGKTHTVRAICAACAALGERPVLLALAARTAKRLEVTTGYPAMTLARALLCLNKDALSGAVVIVDEFGMVDLLDFRRLLRKMPEDARLVLCGDVAQLPSIGPGRLLHSFVFHGSAPVQELERVFRQTDAVIPAVLEKVRSGKLRSLPDFDWMSSRRDGIFVVECSVDHIQRIVPRLYAIFDGDAQVVSALSRSRAGAGALNRVLHRSRRMTADPIPGTPVVFTKNAHLDSGRHVVNGLQGVVKDVLSDGESRPFVPYLCVGTDDGDVVCTRGEYDSIVELGYALTVHRAQGAEWDTVIAVLPRCRLLERSLIYTALSRCKERCIVVTDDAAAIIQAVKLESVYEQRQDRLFHLSG